MQKDLKLGMVLGLVAAIVAIFWLSIHPSLSIKARMLGFHKVGVGEGRFAPNSPNSPTADTTVELETEEGSIPDLTVYEQDEKIKTQKYHIVRKGETLSDISHEYYGSETKWRKIFNANRNVVKNPNAVKPGTKLIIPE